MTDTIPSVYAMAKAVRTHPDAVFVTVFTWDDVTERIDQLEEDGTIFPDNYDPRAYKRSFTKAIESALMDGGDWTEAIDNVIECGLLGHKSPA